MIKISSAVGVQFPANKDGKRSSLPVNRAIWADSVRGVNSTLAERIDTCANWRKDYVTLARDVTQEASKSREAAESIARAGLESARSRLVFERDGQTYSLTEAPGVPADFEFDTETIGGTARPVEELVVPYLGRELRGDALRRQLANWVSRGIIEPSTASALNTVMDHPEWLRLEGRRIAVIGAAAQTSPMPVLTSWGAEVLAIDLAVPKIQERLVKTAQQGASVVHFPARAEADGDLSARTGANLIEDVPELTRWFGTFADSQLVFGFYVYADGPLHVQATLAADVMSTSLLEAGQDVAIAFAGTPSDCFLVSADAVEDSNARRRSRPRRAFELPVRTATLGHIFSPAYHEMLTSADGEQMGLADAIVNEQGPNYLLAKRLQRWRSIDAWSDGNKASFNVAPPTWTVSVTKNRLLAAGYYGARMAGLEVFAPETMNVLMTALMVYDMNVAPHDEHPELAVTRDGVHGGYWRVPHDIRSTLWYTGIVGLPRAYMPEIKAR